MIDGGIWANEKFAELPCMARLLQLGIINMVDDQGRTKAHPAYLRSQIFPYDDVSLEDMSRWLQLMATNGTVILYQVDGKEYLQLVNWWEYQNLQYASPSEYPRPGGWRDRIRYNSKGHVILTHNWTTVGGELLQDLCDENGNPLPIVDTLPPKNPGGRPPKKPPGNPGGNLPDFPPGNINKDQINTSKDQGRDTRARENANPPSSPVSLFQEFCSKSISRVQSEAISTAVTDLELWRNVLREWNLRGYNMGNVNGLLDWYRNGIPEAARNSGDHPPPRTTNRGVAAVTAYIEKKGMSHE